MRMFIFVLFFLPVFVVSADVGEQLKNKSQSVSASIVSDVSRTQKAQSNLLNIQMKIDALRVQIAGVTDQVTKKKLQTEMTSLLKQQSQLRNSVHSK